MGVSSLEFEHHGKSYIQLVRAYIRQTPHSASGIGSNIQATPAKRGGLTNTGRTGLTHCGIPTLAAGSVAI
jgi:hypothetical protein